MANRHAQAYIRASEATAQFFLVEMPNKNHAYSWDIKII